MAEKLYQTGSKLGLWAVLAKCGAFGLNKEFRYDDSIRHVMAYDYEARPDEGAIDQSIPLSNQTIMYWVRRYS